MAEVEDQDQGDSWAQTLEKITAEQQEKVQRQEVALSGRGVRRRAAIAKVVQFCSPVSSSLRCAGDFSQMLTWMERR